MELVHHRTPRSMKTVAKVAIVEMLTKSLIRRLMSEIQAIVYISPKVQVEARLRLGSSIYHCTEVIFMSPFIEPQN